MKKNILTLLILFATALFKPVFSQVDPTLASRFQTVLDSVCNKYRIKGTSAALFIPGQGIWKGTNGYSSSGMPIQENMLLGMGSNTKTHISAALLKAQEMQLVSLDDTIGKWIIGYPNISGSITIRQCLNHTSGLNDYMQNPVFNDSLIQKPSKIWTMPELLSLALQPNFSPGTNWDYSNTNYIVAGIILSQVTGKSYPAAVKELVLDPLQLSSTFAFGEQGTREYAHPWTKILNGSQLTDLTTTPYLDQLYSLAGSAGSLITTAEDNANFWNRLCSGKLLSEDSWKQMTRIQTLGGGDGYGLGIFMYSKKMNGRTFYSHGGTFFGYINENLYDTTSRISIAVLTNQDSIDNNELLLRVIRALHKETLSIVTGNPELKNNSIKEITVYPNPTQGNIHISTNNSAFNGQLILTNMKGEEVYKQSIQGEITETRLTAFQSGLYLLQLTDSEGRIITTRRIQITP